MREILPYIVISLLAVLFIYWLVMYIIAWVKRERFRKQNREAQFSGSAIPEDKGFWASIFTPRYGSRAEAIGDFGERKVSSYLADLPCEEYLVFNDLLVRNGSYTTQIDHLIISPYGIFVLETKNIHGKVYGNESAEFWKQYLPDAGYKWYGNTQEHKLRNPIWQNDGHIKTLRQLVFGSDVPVNGIVVFPNDTGLYIATEYPVLWMDHVVPYIRQFQDLVLSTEQMTLFRRRILEVISTSSSDRVEHINNVHRNMERRNIAVANGICPKCGGTLVLRDGRYGKFYGCSNYPECRYILNK